MIGHFNCTIANGERNTLEGVSTSFANWVQRRSMIDIGFIGLVCTWNHGREILIRRSARLDRAIGDDNWRRYSSEATLRHLPHSHSDHYPILLQTVRTSSSGMGRRPFWFNAAWMEHKGFSKVVEEHWNNETCMPVTLKTLSKSLQDWNTNTFGNIFARKSW